MSKKEDAQGLISQREFARRMGCSDTTVRKAIEAKKIVKGLRHTESGTPRIHYDTAFKEWQQHYNPTYTSNEAVRSKLMANQEPVSQEPPDKSTHSNLAQSKLAQSVYRARLLELEFKQKAGQLVDKKEVYLALYEAGREVKTSIMTVPDRYIDAIFSAKTRNEAHTILAKALIEALDVLSDINNKNILDPNG